MYKNLKNNNDKFTERNSIVFRFFAVITGLVPVILLQQVTNLVNKFALLLHKYRFSQDCRNRLCVMSGNDGCWGRLFMFFPFLKLLNRMYHPGSSANELSLKAKDDYRRVSQFGRSMIEMLGVLAIIAVLSVGGLAGYSKAMEKFKHNKWLQQIETLSFSIQDLYKNQTNYTNSGNNDIIPLLKSVGALPPDMLDKNNNDILGNRVSAYVSTWHNWIRPHFQFDTNPGYNALQTCLDLFHLPLDIASIWTVTFCAGKNCWDDWKYRMCGKKLPADYLEIVPECQYQTTYNRAEIIKNCKICVQEYCTFLVISGNTIY